MPKIHSIIMPLFPLDFPPLGVACLSSSLKKSGVDLSCTDFRLYKNNVRTSAYLGYKDNFAVDIPDLPLILAIVKNYQKDKSLLKDLDGIIKDYVLLRPLSFLKLKRDIYEMHNMISEHLPRLIDYDIILFTTYDTNFLFTIMCSLLLRKKKPDITIVYGGPQVSQSENSQKIALKLGLADVVVIGEGEKIVSDILEAYRSGNSLAVKGTMAYDKDKDIFIRQSAGRLDLDTLDCPDFSLLELKRYPSRNHLLPLYTSRGCICRCNFCNEWKMWHPFRQFKTDRVIEWMKKLNRDYGAFNFYFTDSLLNASLPWLEEFCDKLIKSRLNFGWRGIFRANISKELARKLKKSGLYEAFIGAEGYSQPLLDRMNKKNTARNNIETINALCSSDISLEISSIIGFPYESESDFKKCWELYNNLMEKYPQNILFNAEPFQLRPSSPIYERFKDFGLSVKKWDSQTLNMIPEVKDIISQIPMTVSGRPKPEEIIQRTNIMINSFHKDEYSSFIFSLKYEKQLLRNFLKHIKLSDKLKLGQEVGIECVQRQKPRKNDIFLLRNGFGRYVISKEEKMMVDRMSNKTSLLEMAKDLSKKFKITKQKCIKKIIAFLNDLLENNILFIRFP